jgi:dihydroorotate dehydrogenase electron transfer subunit
MNRQFMVRVDEVVDEAPGIRTLRFDHDAAVRPGQFYMIWLPGLDEVPMSASYIYGKKGITVKAVGEATRALCALKEGTRIGVRGPYGNGFDIQPGKVLIAAGGFGAASVMAAADFIADGQKVDILLGARTKSEIIFHHRARALSGEVHITTDDGSLGREGTVVDLAIEHLDRRPYHMVLACGPEKMLFNLLQACTDRCVECQMSLERFMKCGAGLCGSCAVDGLRVCADGPVFTGLQLSGMNDFGRFKRDVAGLRVKL